MTIEIATFGAGGGEPYARALQHGEPLFLRDTRSRDETRVTMDVSRWYDEADGADLSLLASVTGPVLDIGSGPGRMVRAAMDLGMVALGIDVSATAVRLARELGGSFEHCSVFDPLPREGHWQTALLVDGNIGIGGDVTTLLTRCRDLLTPTGEIVVELDLDPTHELHYLGQVVDSYGHSSATFPWAEIGLDALDELLPPIGLRLAQAWDADGRAFCRLAIAR